MITGEHLCPRALAQNLASQETRSRAGRDQPNKIAHCFLQHKPASGPGDIDYLDEAGFSVTGLHWRPNRMVRKTVAFLVAQYLRKCSRTGALCTKMGISPSCNLLILNSWL